ncbi:MAG: hypothetical protein QOJ74_2442 [Ilumatobacteraceae bacterium]|nr:hypothetical protein [Ilumatobacteraceae bacterium]
MRGNIGDLVDAPDHACLVDEERPPARVLRILLVGRACDLVGGAHCAVDVAEQLVPELLGLGELEVLGGRVERRTEDDAVGCFEPSGTVTQRLSFDRSTRGRCFRVPPQQHPLATEVGEAHVDAVLVGEAELGSVHSGSKHRPRLRDRNQTMRQCPSRLVRLARRWRARATLSSPRCVRATGNWPVRTNEAPAWASAGEIWMP